MSKNKSNKKKYKHYPILTLEDGLVALGYLIVSVSVNLRKYKKYNKELQELLEKYLPFVDENGDSDVLIPADEYESINDRLLYCQREIIKFTADHQKDSFSYMDFRKTLKNNGYLSEGLSENVSDVLSELLDVRNWTFHNPQSLMVANLEVAQKNIPAELKSYVKVNPHINPVIIPHVINYEIKMLCSLSLHVDRRIKQFDLVLQSMKDDYEKMYQKSPNKPVYLVGPKDTSHAIFMERKSTGRYRDESTDVVQISMAIHKSKYDGSVESYNKWAINKVEDSTEEGED